MKTSLRTKLSLPYVLVAVISIALISILTNVFLEKQFQEYVNQNQEQKNKEVLASITQQYQDEGKWNADTIESIGVKALENGLIIKIKDISGKMIWDATVHNNGMCQKIIEHMSENMSKRFHGMKGNYTEKPYPITYNSNAIGTMELGFYGPFYMSDNDLAFINNINKMLMWVGIFSLLFALVLGSLMAKRLSSPISRVIKVAELISKGFYSGRVSEKTTTEEISQLTTTINGLAENLERQELLRKRLTADVAHELRTPLATLQSHVEAMIDGIWKADADRLKSCHEEIVRISKMVGDLEKLAKYEGENLTLNKTKFNISELVQTIIQNFENDFKNKGLAIRFNGDEEIVLADKDKLTQVIINLVSNTLKYTPEGGEVEINVKGDNDITEISVKDTGSGIPEEDLPHIFERFYRADKSRNRLTGGSGIGLTITKALVEAHKGKIEVLSSVNQRTEFIVSLPKPTAEE